MTPTTHHPVRSGELWTIQPDEVQGRPAYWLTYQAARSYADALNRAAEISNEIRRLTNDIATVNRVPMGGDRLAWRIDFHDFDTIDGPYLLLTDDTDERYVVGIYDSRQEVPDGPEPIVETTPLRVELSDKRDGMGVRYPAATATEIATHVADRARFVYNLAFGPDDPRGERDD